MNDILTKSIVLVLNHHGEAINVRTPQDEFHPMATYVPTGLNSTEFATNAVAP